jgi:hypothetical protein
VANNGTIVFPLFPTLLEPIKKRAAPYPHAITTSEIYYSCSPFISSIVPSVCYSTASVLNSVAKGAEFLPQTSKGAATKSEGPAKLAAEFLQNLPKKGHIFANHLSQG